MADYGLNALLADLDFLDGGISALQTAQIQHRVLTGNPVAVSKPLTLHDYQDGVIDSSGSDDSKSDEADEREEPEETAEPETKKAPGDPVCPPAQPAARPTFNYRPYADGIARKYALLHEACLERGTKLFFLPISFQKHRENESFFDNKRREIVWKVGFTLYGLYGHGERHREEALFPESTPLDTVRRHFLSHTPAGDSTPTGRLLVRLEHTAAGCYGDMAAWLPSLSGTLRDLFAGMVVVEYPEFVLELPGSVLPATLLTRGECERYWRRLSAEGLRAYQRRWGPRPGRQGTGPSGPEGRPAVR